MEQQKFEGMTVAGYLVRTTNENQKSLKDISEIWNKINSGKLADLPGTSLVDSSKMYGVYFDYESDFSKPFTFLAGFQVSENVEIPEGLASIRIPERTYTVFNTIEGDLPTRVGEVWQRIWNSGLSRDYEVDFEVYSNLVGEPDIKVYIS